MKRYFHSSRRRHQRGDVLVLALLVLLVMYLGFLYTVRNVMSDTRLVANDMQKQRSVHISDVALRQFEGMVFSTANYKALEFVAQNQVWYRDVPPGTARPTAAYWSGCLGNSNAGQRCGKINVAINGSAIPYTALVALQPADRPVADQCELQNAAARTAMYYDVFMVVQDNSGAFASPIEAVMRICVQ